MVHPRMAFHSLNGSKLCFLHTLTRRSVAGNTPAAFHSSPRIIFSGIQPTGIPHLGNYLGALSNWVQLQRTAAPSDTLLFSVAGWHALTLPQDPKTLRVMRRDIIAVLLSIGIDPARSIIFHQDQIPAHAELAWILNCVTPIGRLKRMTTWKSRLALSRNASESDIDESLLNTGLLTYPVLQAADILLYRATHVPVGEDQKQHLELTRELAEILNRKLQAASFFPLPQRLSTPAQRILSLTSPEFKMSKSSHDPSSRILLTDSPDEIRMKIRKAITDSLPSVGWDTLTRPGVSNLIRILVACENLHAGVMTGNEGTEQEDVIERVVQRFSGPGSGIKHLKAAVADAIVEVFHTPRNELDRLRKDVAYLDSVARDGAQRAQQLAEVTMREVRERIGLA